MKTLCLVLLCAVLQIGVCATEAFRIRQITETQTGETTQHGTAFTHNGYVLTAAHVAAGDGDLFVEQPCGWVRCTRVLIDKDWDVAVLKPAVPVEPTEAKETCCPASIRGRKIVLLKPKRIGTKSSIIPGYDHGGSGAPVYKDGKLIGMTQGYYSTKIDDPAGAEPDVATVPVVVIDSLMESLK